MVSIKNPWPLTVALVLVVVSTAGCIGDGFGASGAPRAVVSVSQVGDDEYTFRFDASGSSGKGLTFQWDLGDGTHATERVVEHTYVHGDGMYQVRLVVENDEAVPDVWEERIKVASGENGAPVALFSPGPRNYALNEGVTVDASATFDPESDPVQYHWDFNHLMSREEYQAFRAERAAALDGEDDDGDRADVPDDDYEENALSSRVLHGPEFDGPRERGLTGDERTSACLGPCPTTGGPGEGNPSLFSHTAETDDPVYTLEEGYPDATVFYIRLQVYDVKGDHEEILSEEIWPVEVWNDPPESFVSDNTNDTFDLGAPGEVTDALNDAGLGGEQVYFEDTWEFVIDWPVAPSKRDGAHFTPGGEITLRWEAEIDYEEGTVDSCQRTDGECVEMTVTAPNGETLNSFSLESGQGQRVELDGNNDYNEGEWETPWKVHVIARDGIEVFWEVDYWMELDTNPFGLLEEGHV